MTTSMMCTPNRAELSMALRQYRLPDGILPLAPTREPFLEHSLEALAAAAMSVIQYKEKRGIVSHAVRAILGQSQPTVSEHSLTIEAHLDGADIPLAVQDRLLEIGFELDGFAKFVPTGFDTHYTYKFKLDADNEQRVALLKVVRQGCKAALEILQRAGVEAYIELEVYPSTNRRYWNLQPASNGWRQHFPLRDGSFEIVLPARDEAEAKQRKVPLDFVKRADIHVKIAKSEGDRFREELITALCNAGFYRVLTWAGNDVCTAQFHRGRDAIRVFESLDAFFSEHHGATEMTIESAPAVWRTELQTSNGRRLAAVPPLVLGVDPGIADRHDNLKVMAASVFS